MREGVREPSLSFTPSSRRDGSMAVGDRFVLQINDGTVCRNRAGRYGAPVFRTGASARPNARSVSWISESPAARPSSAPRAAGSAAPARIGWPRPAARSWSTGATRRATEATAAEIAQGDRRQGHRGRRRRRDRRGPGRAVRRLPGAGHPGQQQCRPAVPRFPRARPPEDDRRRDRQHGRGRSS